jgi:hypothetical protein
MSKQKYTLNIKRTESNNKKANKKCQTCFFSFVFLVMTHGTKLTPGGTNKGER